MSNDRIVKLLVTATHSETNDYEALNAVRLLGSLLKKQGLTAEVLLKGRVQYVADPALQARADASHKAWREAHREAERLQTENAKLRKRDRENKAHWANVAELEPSVALQGAQQAQIKPSRLMVTSQTVQAWAAFQASPGGLGISDLCRLLGYSQTGAKRLAKRFLEAGLLEKTYKPRARYRVAPKSEWTPMGRALVAKIEVEG